MKDDGLGLRDWVATKEAFVYLKYLLFLWLLQTRARRLRDKNVFLPYFIRQKALKMNPFSTHGHS